MLIINVAVNIYKGVYLFLLVSRLRRRKRAIGIMSDEKIENKSLFPETLSPFQQPKEALNKILVQLENPEW